LLLDAGDLCTLNARDIHKITDVFVTHTHIDHFIGFDRLLRIILRRNTPLHVYGPRNITESLMGRLSGYTWNLIEEYPARLVVHEVCDTSIDISEFSAEKGFRKCFMDRKTNSGILLSDSQFSVKAACLNHDIPVLAFSVEEHFHINIDKARLLDRGLPVGPWLSLLKKAIREGESDQRISVNDLEFSVAELSDIVRTSEGQKISYVMDISPTSENIEKVIALVKGSHTLYIEAYFLDEDRQRAIERNHLTARIAGEIARMAHVREVIPLHVSPKYRSCPEKVHREVMAEFKKNYTLNLK
jgi:ribonuclease Z